MDRFRYKSRIKSTPAVPLTGLVWDLFVSRDALTEEMSAAVGKWIGVEAASEKAEAGTKA